MLSLSPHFRLLAACAATALVSAVLTPPAIGHAGPSADFSRLAAPQPEAAYAVEVVRIRMHFDSVLRELREAPVQHLSQSQRAARDSRIADLAAYRDRGIFPHNHDFADEWMPYFVDHRGVRCAVAHLLEQSGRREIVERVAAMDNNVWVARLEGDREFEAWLYESGLTLAEAARIQVPYVETPDEAGPSVGNRINTTAAIVASGLGVAAVAWNAYASGPERSRLRAALGFTAGALGVAIAASRVDAEGAPLVLGMTTGAIGLTSTFMAARTLLGGGERVPATIEEAPEPVSMSIAPSVVPVGEKLGAGISLNVRF